MWELHYCSRCERKFTARYAAGVLCPRCRSTSGVSRMEGGLRRRRRAQARALVALLVCCFAGVLALARNARLAEEQRSVLMLLDDAQIAGRTATDLRQVRVSADLLDLVISEAERRPELFRTSRVAELTPDERLRLRMMWAAVFDGLATLDGLKHRYADFWRLPPLTRRTSHARAFLVAWLAWSAQHAFGLRMVRLAAGNASLEALLDQAVPEFGLPPRTFGHVKERVLELADTVKAAAGHAYLGLLAEAGGATSAERDEAALRLLTQEPEWIRQIQAADTPNAKIAEVRNALDELRPRAFRRWFAHPAAETPPESDAEAAWVRAPRIDAERRASLLARMRPGDLLLMRRDGDPGDAGLPGYWTHGAVFVGSPEETEHGLRAPAVVEQMRRQVPEADSFADAAARAWPLANAHWRADRSRRGDPMRVIAADAAGVRLLSFEEATAVDHLAVLRPRREAAVCAVALLRAFGMLGAPYDERHDLATPTSLSSGELLYGAYRSDTRLHGLSFAAMPGACGAVFPVQSAGLAWDVEAGQAAASLELIAFLEDPPEAGAPPVDEAAEFRASLRRNRWEIQGR